MANDLDLSKVKWDESPQIDTSQVKWDDETPSKNELVESMSLPEKALVSLGKGMYDIPLGIMQRLGFVSPEEVADQRRLYQPLRESGGLVTKGSEFVGQMLPTVTIPGGVTGNLAMRAGTSALAGGALGFMQPTAPNESVAKNTVFGAAGGAAGQVGLGLASKGVNALTKQATMSATAPYNIRTTLGEDTRNPIVQTAETWLEKVPILGLRSFRKKQNMEAEQASKNWLSQYIADPANVDNLVIAREANREVPNRLFEQVKTLVKQVPDKLDPTETRTIATSLLKRYPDIFKKFQDTEREGIIHNILSGVEGRIPTAFGLKKVQVPVTFDEMWTLRKGLGDMLGQAKRKFASGDVDKTTLGEISNLYSAVTKDIDNWTQKIGRPDIKEAFTAANEAYKQYVVRFDILDDAMAKALGQRGAGEMFSPKKLSTELKNIAWKEYKMKDFTPQQIEEMTGLANVLQVVKRAGQYAENPPTGNRWGIPVVLGELAGAGKATAAIPYIAVARFLSGTETGKKLAMAASKIEPTSPQMQALVNLIYRNVPKMTALGGLQ